MRYHLFQGSGFKFSCQHAHQLDHIVMSIYKQTFGALLIGGALVYAYFKFEHRDQQNDCAYSIFRFSVKKMIPLVKDKMNLNSTQIKVLHDLDDILQEGAKHTRDTRMEIMKISAEGIQSGKLNTQIIYRKTTENDEYTNVQTQKALKKMDRFVSTLNPSQKRVLNNTLNTFRKECKI